MKIEELIIPGIVTGRVTDGVAGGVGVGGVTGGVGGVTGGVGGVTGGVGGVTGGVGGVGGITGGDGGGDGGGGGGIGSGEGGEGGGTGVEGENAVSMPSPFLALTAKLYVVPDCKLILNWALTFVFKFSFIGCSTAGNGSPLTTTPFSPPQLT